MKDYFTVEKEYVKEITVERSKFICRIKPIEKESAAKEYLSEIAKKEVGATHNVYAYILEGETVFKFSDDGEPHGTAGQPILEVLKAKNLKNVIAVVTRYFGGIKLGTGGLSRAYSGAVLNCLDCADIVLKTFSAVFSARFEYAVYSKISKFFSDSKVKVLSTDFINGVTVDFAVPEVDKKSFLNSLSLAVSGNLDIKEKYSCYIAYLR